MNEGPIEHLWDAELSDREVSLIGKIIVQWGALEHEIFVQTLLTFDESCGDQIALPKAMNNLQFTDLLALWKERVVTQAQGERSGILQLQHEEILRLKPFRDAIVHGMWDWSASDLTGIRTVRVRKREVLTTHFTADDLADFYRRLARINFKIRFPAGIEDIACHREKGGFYVSRRFLAMMSDGALAKDWLSSLPQSGNIKQKEPDA